VTVDGGLERLIDIMRESSQTPPPTPADFWGLNGPVTKRIVSLDRQRSLRHSLAFQCIVNVGVRGSETVRTRVVQSGALDLVAHILEQWLQKYGVAIHPCSLGSQLAVDQAAAGFFYSDQPRRSNRPRASTLVPGPGQTTALAPLALLPPPPPPANLENRTTATPAAVVPRPQVPVDNSDADIEMGGYEADDARERALHHSDDAMDLDAAPTPDPEQSTAANPNDHATPRAAGGRLPEHGTGALTIPARPPIREEEGMSSSGANSVTGSEDGRATSDDNENPSRAGNANPTRARVGHRPPPLNIAARVPALAADGGGASNQSSPMGTPTRLEAGPTIGGDMTRRDTLRPIALAATATRRRVVTADDSEASDNGENAAVDHLDIATATIDAGINAAQMQDENAMVLEEPEIPPTIEIVESDDIMPPELQNPAAMAAEQARLDMEAGAPPGQRNVPTPPAPGDQLLPNPIPAPLRAEGTRAPRPPIAPAQVIIANGAPRGFHDLSSYIGIASILHPNGDRFSDDSVLLSLQLLAYLSKYPHVRSSFHHPEYPMHQTFKFAEPENLPRRRPVSATSNVFSLVERFTFRPSGNDPTMFKVPPEIQYWAGVIMRNACRKDEGRGGIRQCAHMSCGNWEKGAREFAKCRRCRKAKYCSKPCQSAAWQEGHRFW
jgi:hypothetical protein